MTALAVGVEFDPLKDKILARSRSTPEGCWFWEGALSTDKRYGRLHATGVGEQLAHRVSYRVFVGPIPEGMTLDHLCGQSRCVNPAHLEPVSLRENIMRGSGICAQHARQTHCKRGHEFTPENTYRYADGRRGCRTCQRANRRRHYLETGK